MPKLRTILPGEIFDLIGDLVEIGGEIYLVGGAIRNHLVGKPIQDFDFVLKKNSINAGKLIADQLGGDFYVLDSKRKTVRTLVSINGETQKLDLALYNGADIESDLNARDFTVNAMAVSLTDPDRIIDPTGGQRDLERRRLRQCSPESFDDDPVRTIRAVRFSQEFCLKIDHETQTRITKAAAGLERISAERKRDSLLEIIRTANVQTAFNQMQAMGVFAYIFPDVEKLRDVELTPPHLYNAWDHTMQVVHYCQQIMAQLSFAPKPPEVHPRILQAVERITPFLPALNDFFSDQIVFERSQYQLLALSALFHDAAKAVVDPAFSGERKKFPDHSRVGADLTETWAGSMGFSNREKNIMRNTVRYHMRPSKSPFRDPSRKDLAIHRLFKHAGQAGIHVAILHLADVLTTYEHTITDERWEEALLAIENIFDAYFNRYDLVISPSILLSGTEILDSLHLQPGKQIGDLVTALVEAQIEGKVSTREQAIKFLRQQIASGKDDKRMK